MKRISSLFSKSPASAGLAELQADPDIAQEAKVLDNALHGLKVSSSKQSSAVEAKADHQTEGKREIQFVPLNWKQGGHQPNAHTRRMFTEVGASSVQRGTALFYEKVFQDPVLDRLIRDSTDPHGLRFASWIQEKFGVGEPWTEDRATRVVCPFMSHGHQFQTPHDRSSAHFAAWHSPKREAKDFGKHFKLDDCRLWMRLHFASMREAGAFDHEVFAEYYVKFIGHFVSVYERSATSFARDSARWSLDPENMERYIAAGRTMPDVTGVPQARALRTLAPEERGGSWPYS